MIKSEFKLDDDKTNKYSYLPYGEPYITPATIFTGFTVLCQAYFAAKDNEFEVKLYVNIYIYLFKLNFKDIEFGYVWHSGSYS